MKKVFTFLMALSMMFSLISFSTTNATTVKQSPIKYYRENYKKTPSKNKLNILYDNGFDLDGNELTLPDGQIYYYPVIIGNSVYFMDYNSYLYRYKFSEGAEELVNCSIHHEINPENEELMSETVDGLLAYNHSTSSISYWNMQKEIYNVKLPHDTVYAGFSEGEGYIFRSNSDVYSFKDKKLKKIATNVKLVVITDYGWTPDYYSQPLFLMNDNQLKVYCSSIDKNQDYLYTVNEDGERQP